MDELEPVDPSRFTMRALEKIRQDIADNRGEIQAIRGEIHAFRAEVHQRFGLHDEQLGRLSEGLEAMVAALAELASQQRTTVAYLRKHLRPR